MNGVLVIDKPAGMTSHDVVNRVRRVLKERSVGHLGTLDPMATGVLPLLLGKMTRLAQFFGDSEKAYEGEIRFGFATDTYDSDGEATTAPVEPNLTLEGVREAACEFLGVISQVPPPFSAKKVAGVPAYKLARGKKTFELKAVEVEVKDLEILALEGERVQFRARVAAGTYIRSVAHEMGKLLGVGAHLASLRRTASGEFGVADAVTLERLEEAAREGAIDGLLVHPRRVLPALPCVNATEADVAKIRNGRAVNLPEMSRARLVKVFLGQSELVAVASRVAGTLFQPKVVLVGSS